MQRGANAIQYVAIVARDLIFVIMIYDLVIDPRLFRQLVARYALGIQTDIQRQFDHIITFFPYIFYKIYTFLAIPLFAYIFI